jgi:hypothetical protein
MPEPFSLTMQNLSSRSEGYLDCLDVSSTHSRGQTHALGSQVSQRLSRARPATVPHRTVPDFNPVLHKLARAEMLTTSYISKMILMSFILCFYFQPTCCLLHLPSSIFPSPIPNPPHNNTFPPPSSMPSRSRRGAPQLYYSSPTRCKKAPRCIIRTERNETKSELNCTRQAE